MSPKTRPSRRIGRRRRAFTLIEVIVALSVLAGGILGVMSAFSLCVRAAGSERKVQGALVIAEREIDAAVNLPGNTLDPTSGSTPPYQWSVTYLNKPDQLIMATCTIVWQEQGEPITLVISRVFVPRS